MKFWCFKFRFLMYLHMTYTKANELTLESQAAKSC